MSLYNKYRPTNFDELIVQNKISTEQFEKHHAYLFFGHSGTGKTSSARVYMSQFVPKEEQEMVFKGKHPDYVEVNCAVNNGVDDIRTLVSDVIVTTPLSSKYKFIIFDECHSLTPNAQNALLKIVEEPPKHAKFVFCTTEINKVIPTIRNRCQKIPFLKISESNIEKILKNISSKECFVYDEESIELVASCADGSARNAINLLEQCSAVLDNVEAVSNILNTASKDSFYQLTKYFCAKDRVNCLSVLEKLFDNSLDPNSIMNKYGDYIADLITLRVFDQTKCEFEGKKLMILAQTITDVLKDFKILQNLKLISKLHVLKAMDKF